MQTKFIRNRVYNYSHCLGPGIREGRGFSRPTDFALGPDNIIYLASRGVEFATFGGGLTKADFSPDKHHAIWEYRGPEVGDGFCPWPTSIALDSEENVYLADEYTNGIFVWDKDGNTKDRWDIGMTLEGDPNADKMELLNTFGLPLEYYLRKVVPGMGMEEGKLNGPSGIEFDKNDNAYVVDSRNHRIQVFTRDGKFIFGWGRFGDKPGEFNLPWGINFDKEGRVYVADWKNNRVQKFTPDGTYIATIGTPGHDEGQLHRPSNVAIDKDGDIYVSDWGNHRLNVYDAEGDFITDFHGDAEKFSPATQDRVNIDLDAQKAMLRADMSETYRIHYPVSVNVDDRGNIMVMEVRTSRIQVYRKEQDWSDPQFNL